MSLKYISYIYTPFEFAWCELTYLLPIYLPGCLCLLIDL